MPSKSKFLINRLDKELDVVCLEQESITIGRLISNDLVLNHRAVSRTHAGIKEIGGVFWLFNLSLSNGTLLDGELVHKSPISDGDVVQIGPYLLLMNCPDNAISITVEMELDVHPLDTQPRALQDQTVLIAIPSSPDKPARFGAKKLITGGTRLSKVMPAIAAQALDLYWALRQREAGKMYARTPLHPRGNEKVGKIQFNWRPTLDLSRFSRASLFVWGALVVALLSVAAFFAHANAYSPGELSVTHSSAFVSERNIAVRSNKGDCAGCHGVKQGMLDKCINCHTTPAFQSAPGFQPAIFDAHKRARVGCTDCHTEHAGVKPEEGLMSAGLCSSCHNDAYKIKAGERAGQILGEPHGGGIGYPVVDGVWKWKGLSADLWAAKNLSPSLAQERPADQFHLLHMRGRMQGLVGCTDCHKGDVSASEEFRKSPRGECAKCHGLATTEGGLTVGKRNCYTCHVQHHRNETFDALLAAGASETSIRDYLARLNAGENQAARSTAKPDRPLAGSGGAAAMRQNREATGWSATSSLGALPWYGWLGLIAVLPVVGLVLAFADTARKKRMLIEASREVIETEKGHTTGSLDLEKLKAEGPTYPHPVIDPALCIGCHACVEVCPHDVLTIVNGIASPIHPDQCMEDTSCQVECPTNPKACIVLNTTKKIPHRLIPDRDREYMTNIFGVYLIGDVSGVPLIKNAANEGAKVITHLVEEMRRERPDPAAEYDVAIIGMGPAGLSAAITAKRNNLRYVALEQSKVLRTIRAYPAGKELHFKPDTLRADAGMDVPPSGEKREKRLKEVVLDNWLRAIKENDLVVNEDETCKDIRREGNIISIITERGEEKEEVVYRARRAVLAIGNRGAPRKLNVTGEDLKLYVMPDDTTAGLCRKCGARGRPDARFCPGCGAGIRPGTKAVYLDNRVKYKLADPEYYFNKKCMVVGAGNSAIEAAVALSGFERKGEQITFNGSNEVTLLIRSDFKIDLKFGNKMNIFDCIDAGRVRVIYRAEIKEIKEGEVVLKSTVTGEEMPPLPNDYVFALIGSEKPTKFLHQLGIKII